MNRINLEIMAAIKNSFKLLEKTIEKEPIIFIDAKGKSWFNSYAEDFISKEGIPRKDFVEWLKIGSVHLKNFRYGNIGIHMMALPGKNVITLLKRETGKGASKKLLLTQKEKEILCHLVRGESNKMIADIMKISPGTVNTHLDNIYSKIGCSNRLSACFIALKNGLLLPSRRCSAH